MTYAEKSVLLNDVATRGRVYVAVLNAARTVFGEATTVTNHAERAAWAKKVLGGDSLAHQEVMATLLTEPDPSTVLADDATLQTWVNGLVTFLAVNG